MTTSAETAVVEASSALAKAGSVEPRLLIKTIGVVCCFAIGCGLIWLLVSRSETTDRYTGTDAAHDLSIQREINAVQRETNAEMRATLKSIDSRLGRIEAKLDK